MFDIKVLCDDINNAVLTAEKELISRAGFSPSKEDLKKIVETTSIVSGLNEKIMSAYGQSGTWAANGYLSAKAALVHETGLTRRSIETSLARGKFLSAFPQVNQALLDFEITPDHITSFVPLGHEKYVEFFSEDLEAILEAATTVSGQQFANVCKHWKSMIDSVLDEPTDEYKAFENRRLFLHEMFDGSWFINGYLDPISGKILDKSLQGISQTLYRDKDAGSRAQYFPAQQRADAIGYLAERYIDHQATKSTPLLNTDITVDLADLNADTTTRQYLKKCVEQNGPIAKAHSKQYFEQILCDGAVQVPVRRQDGSFDLGRKLRTAPWRMKRQLMLKTETCSVPGCSTPSSWCDAHHVKHWLHGGETKIENLALLCRRHHTIVHNDKTFEEKLAKWLNQKSPPLVKN